MFRVLVVVVLALLVGPGFALADLSTGLIAHYPFDGAVTDASGNGNHGTIIGALVSTTDRNGSPDHAYEFNGSNTYVRVPSSPSLASPTNQITMSAWILLYGNSHVGSPFSPILMKSLEGSNAFMYRMLVSTTYFGAAYTDWNLTQTTGASVLNQWAHVATTYDGTKHRFFLNGAQVDSANLSVTMTADTRALTIGADFPGVFEVFWGKIDDVRIYDRALSRQEIAALYTGPVGVEDETPVAVSVGPRAFPNPTRGACAFAFALKEPGNVEVAIHDVAGRLVRTLSPGMLAAGPHAVQWDGRRQSGAAAGPGLYFAEFRTPHERAVGRVLLVR